MKRSTKAGLCWLIALLLALELPALGGSKSYSSGGGRSYSSSSSRSSSFSSSRSSSSSSSTRSSSSGGGSTRTYSSGNSRPSSPSSSSTKTFSSGSGKSYTSSGSGSSSDQRGYSSGKSYTAGSIKSSNSKSSSPGSSSGFTFDSTAARARKEEASKQEFSKFKQSQSPPANPSGFASKPGPSTTSSGSSYRNYRYVPDYYTISTRPTRIYNFYQPYYSRPWVIYNDPYGSYFWWWLLDRSLDDRAYWAYHHHYDMDPGRYSALMAQDQQLQARVAQLEAQQVGRDPSYTPPGLDRDLMYSDQYVTRNYQARPTQSGAIAFWLLGVPLAIGICVFFIWLIWFKRWQTAS